MPKCVGMHFLVQQVEEYFNKPFIFVQEYKEYLTAYKELVKRHHGVIERFDRSFYVCLSACNYAFIHQRANWMCAE